MSSSSISPNSEKDSRASFWDDNWDPKEFGDPTELNTKDKTGFYSNLPPDQYKANQIEKYVNNNNSFSPNSDDLSEFDARFGKNNESQNDTANIPSHKLVNPYSRQRSLSLESRPPSFLDSIEKLFIKETNTPPGEKYNDNQHSTDSLDAIVIDNLQEDDIYDPLNTPRNKSKNEDHNKHYPKYVSNKFNQVYRGGNNMEAVIDRSYDLKDKHSLKQETIINSLLKEFDKHLSHSDLNEKLKKETKDFLEALIKKIAPLGEPNESDLIKVNKAIKTLSETSEDTLVTVARFCGKTSSVNAEDYLRGNQLHDLAFRTIIGSLTSPLTSAIAKTIVDTIEKNEKATTEDIVNKVIKDNILNLKPNEKINEIFNYLEPKITTDDAEKDIDAQKDIRKKLLTAGVFFMSFPLMSELRKSLTNDNFKKAQAAVKILQNKLNGSELYNSQNQELSQVRQQGNNSKKPQPPKKLPQNNSEVENFDVKKKEKENEIVPEKMVEYLFGDAPTISNKLVEIMSLFN